MGFLDILFSESNDNKKHDWDQSVFDTDRFRSRNSGNWVDWEDVSTSDVKTDGFEPPNYNDNGEW